MDTGNTVMWESKSESYQKALKALETLSVHDVTVVFEGETGTGKELFVEAIHKKSPRASGPLIAVNLAGVPASLFESQFFGYRKGAFTGAQENWTGFFGTADRGTLFLDEFNSMSVELQPKFLRVLETRTYLPVGDVRTRKSDARVVLATNVPLHVLRDEGRIREDLFYRLQTHRIRIPPLRERLEDLPVLVDSLVRHFSRRYGKNCPEVERGVLSALSAYRWPGNVRELSERISSAVLHSPDGRLTLSLLFPEEKDAIFSPYSLAREDWEFSYFDDVYRATGGDPGEGRRITGLSPTTYRRKIRQYQRKRPFLKAPP
ncbi:MAG: sigma 54-interacting transcriptional regulator [Leptospirales bacterium]